MASVTPPPASAFDSAWYLDRNPDVANAMARGLVPDAYTHWMTAGQAEGRTPPPGYCEPEPFDEVAYLAANPDVAEAVGAGRLQSGHRHYLDTGSAEGRSLRPATTAPQPPDLTAGFDEAWYLAQNPDIAEAVARGAFPSGYAHWASTGHHEGRAAPPRHSGAASDQEAAADPLDEAFYRRAYPAVTDDLAASRATGARHHYATLGRFRGYLPHPSATRPPNPAGIGSPLGGLWPDQANAQDIIEGRREIGQLTAEQATLLQQWTRFGCVTLPQKLPAALVDDAAADLRRAFDGTLDGVRFDCPSIGSHHPVPWDPAVKRDPAAALDLHWLSPAIRELVLAGPLRAFLELLFERRAMASQSQAFLHGTAAPYARDSLTVPYSLPLQFAASWIALEDILPGTGEVSCIPGSHRHPEAPVGDDPASAQPLPARKGDVTLWHAQLAHACLPAAAAAGTTRASLLTHYCPQEVAPGGFERKHAARRSHHAVAFYATSVYRDP